jgi:hypothetical protein
MSEGTGEVLRQLEASPWFQIGRKSAEAYARHEEWLFRRVETIEFADLRSVKRSISVDFEMPRCGLPCLGDWAARGTALVPVSVLHKWPPLIGFQLVGPEGHPLSLYREATRRKLNFGLLLGMADRALALGESAREQAFWCLRRGVALRLEWPARERLPLALRQELARIVHRPEPKQADVRDAVNHLRSELNGRLGDALESASERVRDEVANQIVLTVDLAARLAGSSILWVAVEGKPGTDRIVKFSYFDEYSRRRPELAGEPTVSSGGGADRLRSTVGSGWRRLATSCAWRRGTLFIALPHAGRHVRYHLDVLPPQGSLELVKVDALALPPAEGSEDVGVRSVAEIARDSLDLDLPDEWVGPQSSRYFMTYGKPTKLADATARSSPVVGGRMGDDEEASAEIADRRAHIYLGARSAPSHRVFLQVKLAAPRWGFITACAIAALMITALMSTAYVSLSSIAGHLEATVVLFSVVPVVLGYVLVRPGESALEHEHVTGVRLMALISGATPIFGALVLVFTSTKTKEHPPDLTLVRPIWLVLLIVSGLMAAGLVVSWLSPRYWERRKRVLKD